MKNGKIYVVGMGPGNLEHMTPAATTAIAMSDVIVGYTAYIELIKPLLEGKEVDSTGMKKEVDRCSTAVEYAKAGKVVSVISSGDAGVYGMAGLVLELADGIEVEIVPGVSAANAAAAVLGAPLMHDFAVISLSDLLTEWTTIEKRLNCAAEGDFITAIYNPKSLKRVMQIEATRDIMLKHRAPSTPVGIVRNAMRSDQHVVVTTLQDMLTHEIDMFTTVIIGNTNTFVKEGKMVTPRGYRV